MEGIMRQCEGKWWPTACTREDQFGECFLSWTPEPNITSKRKLWSSVGSESEAVTVCIALCLIRKDKQVSCSVKAVFFHNTKKNDNIPGSDISFCFFSEAQCLVHIRLDLWLLDFCTWMKITATSTTPKDLKTSWISVRTMWAPMCSLKCV